MHRRKRRRRRHLSPDLHGSIPPIVVLCAVVLAVIPPLLVGNWSVWIQRACYFPGCLRPCALVISVPLGFFSGIGSASRQGVLVKGGNYLEALADMGVVVFDKTGTLTKGTFEVSRVQPVGMEPEALLELAALAESGSNHPIARSIQAAWGRPMDLARVTDWSERSGHGVSAKIDGHLVLAATKSSAEQKKSRWNKRPRPQRCISQEMAYSAAIWRLRMSSSRKPRRHWRNACGWRSEDRDADRRPGSSCQACGGRGWCG